MDEYTYRRVLNYFLEAMEMNMKIVKVAKHVAEEYGLSTDVNISVPSLHTDIYINKKEHGIEETVVKIEVTDKVRIISNSGKYSVSVSDPHLRYLLEKEISSNI